MHASKIITLLGLVPSSYAMPVSASSLSPVIRRATCSSGCMDPEKDPTPLCYEELQVDAYIGTWWEENQADCESNYAEYGFASCYQQKMGRGALLSQQCDKIGPSQCTRPGNFSEYEPVNYYVLTSIFGIWQWFNSIYDASGFTDGTVAGSIGNITEFLNPSSSENSDLTQSIILSALTFGLTAIRLPSIAAGLDTILTISETANVADALFQTGTAQSQILQISDIQAQLSEVIVAFQTNVANALSILQSNVTSLRAFTRKGAFIAPDADLNASTASLSQSLTTYVVSQSLAANGWLIIFTPDTNPYELRNNGSLPSQYNDYVNCQDPPDRYGVCDRWFFDGKDAYSLWDGKSRYNNPYDTMETIFNNSWTTGELLFDAALACWINVDVHGGSTVPSINMTTLQPYCVSSMFVDMMGQPIVCLQGQHGCAQNTFQNGTSCFWDQGPECWFDTFGYTSINGTDYRAQIKQINGPVNAYLDGQGL